MKHLSRSVWEFVFDLPAPPVSAEMKPVYEPSQKLSTPSHCSGVCLAGHWHQHFAASFCPAGRGACLQFCRQTERDKFCSKECFFPIAESPAGGIQRRCHGIAGVRRDANASLRQSMPGESCSGALRGSNSHQPPEKTVRFLTSSPQERSRNLRAACSTH